jgi:hypothetical protein
LDVCNVGGSRYTNCSFRFWGIYCTPPELNATDEYNGFTWSIGWKFRLRSTAYGAGGTQTAALASGGILPSPGTQQLMNMMDLLGQLEEL